MFQSQAKMTQTVPTKITDHRISGNGVYSIDSNNQRILWLNYMKWPYNGDLGINGFITITTSYPATFKVTEYFIEYPNSSGFPRIVVESNMINAVAGQGVGTSYFRGGSTHINEEHTQYDAFRVVIKTTIEQISPLTREVPIVLGARGMGMR